MHERVDREEVVAALERTLPSAGFYLAALALALVAPRVAALGFLAIAMGALVPSRRRALEPDGPSSRAP